MKIKKKHIVAITVMVLLLIGIIVIIIFSLGNNDHQAGVSSNTVSNNNTVVADSTTNTQEDSSIENADDNINNPEANKKDSNTNKKTTSAQKEDNNKQSKDKKTSTDTNSQSSNTSHPQQQEQQQGPQQQQQPQPQSQPTPIFRGITTMQEMTPEVCASEPTPAYTVTARTSEHQGGVATAIPQIALKDTRDGKSYYIRKLADGNCWMIQNLAYYSSNITNGHIKNDTAQNSGSTSNLCVSGNSVETCENNIEIANPKRIGHYYHFAVTWADTKVCPGSWVIPGKSNGSKNFQSLIDAYPSNLKTAINYNEGGEVDRGSVINQGVKGLFWTNYSDGFANRTLWAFNGTGFSSYGEQSHWFSIRCVI